MGLRSTTPSNLNKLAWNPMATLRIPPRLGAAKVPITPNEAFHPYLARLLPRITPPAPGPIPLANVGPIDPTALRRVTAPPNLG
jgi:hypothetical protein